MNTPVSFELAKLLKEKEFGIDEENDDYIQLPRFYDEDGNYVEYDVHISRKYDPSPYHLGADTINDFEAHLTMIDNSLDDICLAPTIAEVVMWLYEKHEIWIEVRHIKTFNVNRFHVIIWYYKDTSDYITIHCENGVGYEVWDSPTEAYEAAIDYTLNNLL